MASKREPPVPNDGANESIKPRPKRPVGRPPLELPDPIPDTPENIARIILNTKPKRARRMAFRETTQAQKRQVEVYDSISACRSSFRLAT